MFGRKLNKISGNVQVYNVQTNIASVVYNKLSFWFFGLLRSVFSKCLDWAEAETAVAGVL